MAIGEMIVLELFAPSGGGLRATLTSVDTHLDGHRETLRSYVRGYGGAAGGSTIRQIELNEYMDGEWLGQGIDFEAEFKFVTTLVYRLTMVASGRKAEGKCHIIKTAMKSADGKAAEINCSLEGEDNLFA